jgi:hypothetical protein
MFISDIVLLEELTEEQRKDEDLIAGVRWRCGFESEYISLIQYAGSKSKFWKR